MVLFFSEINKPIDFGDKSIEIFNSILVPVYKGGKRVLTYKLDLENDEYGEVYLAEISVKKAEISEYKYLKFIESKSGSLDIENVFDTFYGYVKKGVKRLGLNPDEFIESTGKLAYVTNMAIFDDDELEENGKEAITYWSKYRISKIDGNKAIWFNSLISEDASVVKSFYDAGAELVEIEEIAMDTEDPFSFVKYLGIDFERVLEEDQVDENQEDEAIV